VLVKVAAHAIVGHVVAVVTLLLVVDAFVVILGRHLVDVGVDV
jgi:hypothetical protein